MLLKKTSASTSTKKKNKKNISTAINLEMPEEFEEQRSMALRMHPQPYNKYSKK
jgi:hypothetical protein